MVEESTAPWRAKRRVRLTIAGILAVLVGVYGSAFGPFYVAVLGAILLIIGLAALVRGARSGSVWLTIGTGLVIGAAVYVALGVFGPSDPPSQSGCRMSTGELCTIR